MNPALRRIVYYPNMDGIVSAKGFVKGFMKWKEEDENNQITGKVFEKQDYGILLSAMQT